MRNIENILVILYLAIELLYAGQLIEFEFSCWILTSQLSLKVIVSFMETVMRQKIGYSYCLEWILLGKLQDDVVGDSGDWTDN